MSIAYLDSEVIREDERLIDIPEKSDDRLRVEHKVTVRYDETCNNKIRVRKKQLFDKLNIYKLTYVKGGICDSFIKYGYPSLDEVITDVRNSTDDEDNRLDKLVRYLEKRNLKYDSRVSYYREYVEQGTNLKIAISRGKKEWFLLNKTRYLKLLKIYRDEERAEQVAIERYLRKNGCDRQFKNHIGVRREFEMKIRLY